MEKFFDVKPREGFNATFNVSFFNLLSSEKERIREVLKSKPDIQRVSIVELRGKNQYLQVIINPESENCNVEYLRKLINEVLTQEFYKIEQPSEEEATVELPEEVREGLKKSLIPEASEALYRWYKSDEAHRAVMTLTVDEEKGVVGGEILGREQFHGIIREYVRRNAFTNSTADRFFEVLFEAAGTDNALLNDLVSGCFEGII